ncbi:hypothetical protein ACER0A_004595 [Haloimpatiens sp. FM7315]|uniref:hypothetical protein n=1 Tax=Haloimpatiens sp. FM7315 TaxID=3298609 RepID=UPI0035A3272A
MKKIRNENKVFLVAVVAIIICILAFQYNINFGINKNPPSVKWGKGLKISEAKVNTYPLIIKEDKGYLVAINNEDKVKIMKFNSAAVKLSEKEFKINSSIISNLNFIKNHEGNYIISYDSKKVSGSEENLIKLDENLNKISEETINGVNESSQIDDKIIIRGYEDSIQVVNMQKNENLKVKANKVIMSRGVKINDNNYLIVYLTQNGALNAFNYEDNKITSQKELFTFNLSPNQIIINSALGTDGNKIYLIMCKKVKNNFQTDKYVFDINKMSEFTYEKLRVPNIYDINDVKFVQNEDGKALFLVGGSRDFGIKKTYTDVFEMYVKDNKVSIGSFLSKSSQVTVFPALSKDIAIYCDYNPSKENHNVYIASTNQDFKEKNNKVSSLERKLAFLDTLQGFMYSLTYLLIIGLKWIIPSAVIMCIISLFEYKINVKWKKRIYIIASIVTFLIKAKTIQYTNYKVYAYYLPKALMSPILGVLINLMFSLVCYSYGYYKYKDDLEAMPVVKFIPYVLLDSIFTLLVFAPYML